MVGLTLDELSTFWTLLEVLLEGISAGVVRADGGDGSLVNGGGLRLVLLVGHGGGGGGGGGDEGDGDDVTALAIELVVFEDWRLFRRTNKQSWGFQ